MSSGFFMNESFWRSSDFQKMNDCLIFSLFDGKSFLTPPTSVTLLGAEVSRNIFFFALTVSENAARYFGQNMFVTITSVSFKMKLENQKWTPCPVICAPGVAKSWRSRLNRFNFSSLKPTGLCFG